MKISTHKKTATKATAGSLTCSNSIKLSQNNKPCEKLAKNAVKINFSDEVDVLDDLTKSTKQIIEKNTE